VSDIDAALLAGWNASEPILIADTRTGRIFRVRLSDGSTAVVKVLRQVGIDYELRGADFLAWRDGLGCARLLASHGATLLLEDVGNRSLLAYLSQYGDAAATAIAAEAVVAIHGASSRPTPATLQPLKGWFASLFALAVRPDVDDLFAHGARIARSLLDDERDVRPLHGDLHHENLFHTRRGWLAIDPKGLIGDPAYDVANMFYNPLDRDDLRTDPGRILSMARAFAQAVGREPGTVLRWAFAHVCLSAAWHAEDGDGDKAAADLGVAAAVHSVLGD
jgi:streptomycin 6-kinase